MLAYGAPNMALLLGIDTGGTYTDAVLFDQEHGSSTKGVIASAKALTTRHDLSEGIRNAMAAVLSGVQARSIELVSLSTTLATNSIVEGQGSTICLVLIGYTPDMLEQVGLREVMGNDPVILLRGGHDAAGGETASLDEQEALAAIGRHAPKVAAFAVSGYFSVRNPAHENQVRRLIREHCGLPVTCGHELTSNLHASRRALTAALNARLISLLGELIRSVQSMMSGFDIRAPLMVVKGDGSLIDSGLALEYPVETILSGPAASVVGSLFLSGETDTCVVDMGGTTTDIALVKEGRLLLNREGATVGGWQTMVEAVQIHTYGLGGDSEVRLEEGGGLALGPRRQVPLSLLAHQQPQVLEDLRRQAIRKKTQRHDGRFLVPLRALSAIQGSFSAVQRAIAERVGSSALALERLYQSGESEYLVDLELRRLVERGILGMSGFTPTDASHVLGLQGSWSAEGARLGAEIMSRTWAARQAEAPAERSLAEQFCGHVLRQVTLQVGRSILSAALAESHGIILEEHERLRSVLIDPAILADGQASGLVGVRLTLKRPLVAIGAPVATYFPAVAQSLHTRLCVPPHAEVANAVGAVVGSVMQTVRVLITPLEGEAGFRVHLPDEVHDFAELEEAVEFAQRQAALLAEAWARRAGAWTVQVSPSRRDHVVEVSGDLLFIESEVSATAAGRPRLAHEVVA
jgi:N-methylhydantoinase A/oxoprolinase/acetone carboxylase beta subunit